MTLRTGVVRYLAAAALLISVYSVGAFAQAAPAAAADPWARVPALPTGYYVNDGFQEKLNKAQEALAADIARQTKLNADLKQQFDAMDIREKTRRMQAFMMKNPQQAMKFVQAQQAAGQTANAGGTTSSTELPKLDQEFKTLSANFKMSTAAAVKPVEIQIQQFIKAKSTPTEGGVNFPNPADRKQFEALIISQNPAYEKAAAPYFGSGGSIPSYLARFKTYLGTEITTMEAIDGAVTAQMMIMDTPTGGYRSTATLDAVRKYMNRLDAAYVIRWPSPRKP